MYRTGKKEGFPQLRAEYQMVENRAVKRGE